MGELLNTPTGQIFNIQRFSIHDGPGIRTTVFLKGCNLRCLWCHNPESVKEKQEILYFPEKCLLCGVCMDECPNHAHQVEWDQHVYDRGLCQECMKCINECFSGALVLSGRAYRVDEVLAEIQKDIDYYQSSGGGVTLSGGEPLLQPDFLVKLLKACKMHGFHCAVDTAGNVPWDVILTILPMTDLFLFDLKSISPEIHRRATGVDNHRILQNLVNLVGLKKRVWIRIPIVPGINTEPAEIEAFAHFLELLASGIERIELLPYHSLGSEKYTSLAREYPAAGFDVPGTTMMESIRKTLSTRNLPVFIMH